MAHETQKARPELVDLWHVVIDMTGEEVKMVGAFPCKKKAQGYICQRTKSDLYAIKTVPWYEFANLITLMAVGREWSL